MGASCVLPSVASLTGRSLVCTNPYSSVPNRRLFLTSLEQAKKVQKKLNVKGNFSYKH